MQHKYTKGNIFLFICLNPCHRLIKMLTFTPMPLLWRSVPSNTGVKVISAKMTTEYSLTKLEMQFFRMSHEINLKALNITLRR